MVASQSTATLAGMKSIYVFATLSFFVTSLSAQTPLAPINWNVVTVKDPQQSAGFIDVADLNGNGKKEIVLSTLIEQGSASSPWNAAGAMRIFHMPAAGIQGTWTEQIILPLSAGLPFINDPQIMDVDEDGNLDLVVNQGFLQTNGGSHQWIKGPAFSQRFDFAPTTAHGNTWYVWHEARQHDLDGDGKLDIITTSAQIQDASNNNTNSINPKKGRIEWYRHLGNGQFDHHIINDSLGGVFIKLFDIDKDGDLDIVVSQFFWGVSRPALVWLEQIAAPGVANNYQGVWEYHVIDNTTGLGYYFEFYDIDLDGEYELVYDNHNNQNNANINYGSGVVMPELCYFKIPQNPTQSSQWPKTTIYNGFRSNLFDFGNPDSQGCPGIFSIGDVDGNGYPDIACPGDGNDTLYLFRQIPGNVFVKEVVDIGKMFGMAKITDLDGDGKNEIVAAKHNFPEWFQILTPPAGFLKIYRPNLNCTPTPAHITALPSATICDGQTATLQANLAQYYVWNTLEVTQQISVTEAGIYQVITTNNAGCPSNAQVQIQVNVHPLPTAPNITQNGNTLETGSAASWQWYLNGVAIGGANSQSYAPIAPGNYTVVITDANGCSAESAPFSYTTGIKAEFQNDFIILPNPATDFVSVQFNNEFSNGLMRIFDLSGRVQFSMNMPQGLSQYTLNISEFESGIYMLTLEEELGKIYTGKVVVVH